MGYILLAFPLLKVMMMITINKSKTKKQNRARGNEYIDRQIDSYSVAWERGFTRAGKKRKKDKKEKEKGKCVCYYQQRKSGGGGHQRMEGLAMLKQLIGQLQQLLDSHHHSSSSSSSSSVLQQQSSHQTIFLQHHPPRLVFLLFFQIYFHFIHF